MHGDKAYKYKVTQQPWMDRKMNRYWMRLVDEVEAANANGPAVALNIPAHAEATEGRR